MKVLLIDDSPKQRRVGKATLEARGDHVTVFSSYVEARLASETQKFDAALIDLMMPSEGMMLSQEGFTDHLGREEGVGFPMIFALVMHGIPKIAVVTDTNHHAHPLSAMVDWFDQTSFTINGSRVLIRHAKFHPDGTKDWCHALDELNSL